MKRPTLYDVAKKAGVSHMTVSRVLHQVTGVKAATREKVSRAIRETGYHPDPALSALAAYRSREGGARGSVLAFLDCDGTPYSGIVLQGVKKEASFLGYTVEVFRLGREKKEQVKLNRILFHRGVRGLLFGPSNGPQTFEGWDWKEFAAVSLGALSHRPAMNCVTPDYFQGAFTACVDLAKAGCRRIGFVIEAGLEARTGHRWLGGYKAGLNAGSKNYIYPASQRRLSDLKLWAQKNSIDGVLTIHEEVWSALAPAGIRVIFLNDQNQLPALPRLQLDPGHIGAEGVRLLHHHLLRREFGLPSEPKMVSLQGTWSKILR